MKEGVTNFSYLMELLDMKTADLCEAIGADKTLISRWRSGGRRLMPGHHWAKKIAAYFLQTEAERKYPVLRQVLEVYYPGEKPNTPEKLEALLIHWLTTAGQQEAAYRQRREGVFAALTHKMRQLARPEPLPEAEPEPPPRLPRLKNAVVYGVEGVQGSTLQFLEMVTGQPEPRELLFACPEGLDMLTRDKRFLPRFTRALMALFEAGHRMSVVIRTDYRISDIAAFSGPWLVAHLLGYIQSYYYDDFVNGSKEKMLAVVPGIMAGRVSETESGKIYTAIRFDEKTVEATYTDIKALHAKSKQRFHYRLFEQPDGFLRSALPLADKAHYQFALLPHFCTAEKETLKSGFQLSAEEMSLFTREFSPLLTSPGFFEPGAIVRHLFCEDAIEDALLKSRHVSQELSAITGRRVVMTTQALVDRLVLLKKTLTEHKNYELCFLPEDAFQKLTMQIACWGDRAAIGWIAGGKSTACRDYTNVNALTGFCESVWETIPGIARQRRMALHKLNTWLKKAAKYGYEV